ncbi:hypothetical protein H0H92_013779 [Tricholoma furcatifolium]|nr:hypothetical protein H0H92_013779 [Tricholoma furcatifolium]
MKLSNAFGILFPMYFSIQEAFIPTLHEIVRSPSILLRPSSISRIFMSKLWIALGSGIDTNLRPTKEHLITPNAHGVVLDIGAGYGHTTAYLDRKLVTKYVALEPNTFMHPRLREAGNAAGFFESDDTFIILACGAEDTDTILSSLMSSQQPHRVDTIVSILTLCSVPLPHKTVTSLMTSVLNPEGHFLWCEHVQNPKPDVAWWQRFWTPLWSLLFDGCRLDRPTDVWIENICDEQGRSVWDRKVVWGFNEAESEDALLRHRVGMMVKRAVDS